MKLSNIIVHDICFPGWLQQPRLSLQTSSISNQKARWPSGLRRCVQVLYELVTIRSLERGLGSNPSLVSFLFVFLASHYHQQQPASVSNTNKLFEHHIVACNWLTQADKRYCLCLQPHHQWRSSFSDWWCYCASRFIYWGLLIGHFCNWVARL